MKMVIQCSPKYRHLLPSNEDVILMHEDFKLFLLANPGSFPYHGNNISVIDVCGILVDPPKSNAMYDILMSYKASHVDKNVVLKIANVFETLSDLNVKGKLNYAYSLREAISIVKHLSLSKEVSLDEAISNVFSYEIENGHRKLISDTFERQGITLSQYFVEEGPAFLNSDPSLSKAVSYKYSNPNRKSEGPKHGKYDGKRHVGGRIFFK